MKKFIVFGLGISGKAAVDFLLKQGFEVLAGDDNLKSLTKLPKNPHLKIIENINEINWQGIESLVLAAGINLKYPKPHPIVLEAKKNHCPIVCDVEILFLFNQTANFIGITGTNGKSTTTALTGHIFDATNKPHTIGGNIGLAALSLPRLNQGGTYVIEASSYQLDLVQKTKFHISNLLNITPDHLDHHGGMENYISAKKRIFQNQTKEDFAIIGIDNKDSRKVFEDLKNDQNFKAKLIPISTKEIIEGGISIIGDDLHNIDGEIFNLKNRLLKGEHNSQNIAFAFANSFLSGIEPKQIIPAIENFQGLKHRMELVANIDGINFINDSKATNAESTENALKSFENIYWIVGGKPKDGGIEMLKPYFPKVKYAFLIGESMDEFVKTLDKKVELVKCKDLEIAFKLAHQMALKDSSPEKNILLSPSCASFDQWKSFEERGEFFCDLVKKIESAHT
ncbi:MAG: UDP-N-acetylmuramoylalanine--D-glutamate ligase [Rickettsiales bacterium]|jgi:UDP-N-acetylmuramoylalanine--D-glutamate ligase